MLPLTKKQHQTLEFLKNFSEKKGYMPTIEQIAKRFRISTVSAWERLDLIKKKGYIDRKWNSRQGLVIKKSISRSICKSCGNKL